MTRTRSIVVGCAAVAGVVAAAVGAQGCSLATPFRGPGVTVAGAGDTCVVAVTHAVLDHARRAPFDEYTRKVIDMLPANDGFVGHSVRTRLFGNEVWTMTVWRDHAAVDAFAASDTHVAAIRAGMPAVVSAQFLRFDVATSAIPPRWSEALERLKDVETVDYRRPPARK